MLRQVQCMSLIVVEALLVTVAAAAAMTHTTMEAPAITTVAILKVGVNFLLNT